MNVRVAKVLKSLILTFLVVFILEYLFKFGWATITFSDALILLREISTTFYALVIFVVIYFLWIDKRKGISKNERY